MNWSLARIGRAERIRLVRPLVEMTKRELLKFVIGAKNAGQRVAGLWSPREVFRIT